MVKVSVIMGIYNCESTLEEAINSLLTQNFQNFNIIMCDDGSIDNTFDIAKNYAENYKDKIILLKNDINKGLNYTLNKCLSVAEGKYIARMDADDISLNERFLKQVNFLDSNPKIDFVSTSMIYFDENGDYGRSYPTINPTKKDFMTETSPFAHAPSMIRKNALDSVKGYTVDDKLLRVEDYHLWTKLYAKGYVGYNMLEPLYKMRNDLNATKRRTFNNRINESYSMKLAVEMLGLPKWNYIHPIKPLIKGLVPNSLYKKIHIKRLKNKGIK